MEMGQYLNIIRSITSIAAEEDDVKFKCQYLTWSWNRPNRDVVFPLHYHSGYELLIPAGAPYHCTVDSVCLTVKKGEFLLLYPGQNHSDHYEGSADFYGFGFRLLTLGSELPLIIFNLDVTPAQQIARFSTPEDVLLLNEILLRETQNGEAMRSGPIYQSILRVILYKALNSYPDGIIKFSVLTSDSCHGEKYNQILQVFSRFVRKNLTLEQLAHECGMSKSSLNNFCHSYFSLSPQKAFVNFRLFNASKLLENNPNINVTEVADYFGFSSVFHFSRIYKLYFGVSPRDHKDAVLNRRQRPITEFKQ